PCRSWCFRRRLVVPQGLDKLVLAHAGPALDADFPGLLHQVGLGPVLVGPALAALGRDLAPPAAGRGVGDPRGLLLALALLPQLLVQLLVLDLGPGHGFTSTCRLGLRYPANRPSIRRA